MHYLECEKGWSIERFAEDLYKVNKVVNVVGIFNGIYLYTKKRDSVRHIIDQYYMRCEEVNKNYNY